MTTPNILAVLGCSGPIGQPFVDGFVKQGFDVRVLAREVESVQARHPKAKVIRGSLLTVADVARVIEGVDAAFLLTPMGVNNDPALEIDAAKAVIAAAQQVRLKQLIFVSVLGADRPRGVAVLDAKFEVERLLKSSGIACSVIRCGSYMEDVFDARVELLKKGKFLFPLTKTRQFSYTSQQDVAPFVTQHVLGHAEMLNRTIDFVSPGTYSVAEVERLLSEAAGHPVRAPAKFPTFYLFLAMLPVFRWRRHRFATILPLLQYFDVHGYTPTIETVSAGFPEFPMTSLRQHLRTLLAG